jgi:RNA polymerase sigma-70 factor (ECF subfamily)
MSQEPSFDELMGRLRAGDDAAATEMFRRYARRLVGMARIRLHGPMNRVVDPDDVVQTAFRTFFRRLEDNQFDPDNWHELWNLLVCITLRKCGREIQFFLAQCRDLRRDLAPAASTADSNASWQAIAREPTPDEAVVLTDTLERVLGAMNDRDGRIVEMTLAGISVVEISEKMSCSERTVERVREKLRQRLEAMVT